MPSFVDQVIHPLILANYDPKLNPLANLPGKFTKKPVRTTDMKVTTNAINDLTEKGYIDPKNPVDKQFVRELLGLS